MIKATVQIKLKSGVLDAQGKAIEGVVDQYNVEGIESVRVGRLVELNFKSNKIIDEQVKTLCEQLLVNPEMEEYSYTIEERDDK